MRNIRIHIAIVMTLAVSPFCLNAATGSGTLEDAYKKEYAFLAAQQRELKKRISAFASTRKKEVAALEYKVSRLENEIIDMASGIEQMEEQLLETERAQEQQEERSEALDMMFNQAEATLSSYHLPLHKKNFDDADPAVKLQQVFNQAITLLQQTNSVHQRDGKFYLQDGTETKGSIIEVGKIAAYGVSDLGSGALVPAGDNLFKLWSQPARLTAESLSKGEQPDILSTFLFESTEKAIEEKQEKTIVETINDGGVIAWIIIALGTIALLLVIVRTLYLWQSSLSAGRLASEVSDLVSNGKTDAALQQCKQTKGSIAQVLSATIRNLDKDRDHLEDVVSEAILHESSHLNRFGSVILLVAAVAPLLGLLGTVTGMIATFDVITEFGTGDPKLLSGGISIALITTEIGLAIAIPTLMLGTLLSGWAERIKDAMEQAALKIANLYYGSKVKVTPVNEPAESHLAAVAGVPLMGV
ncbi:MAG: MotA/TolQ/ExbB proton channel family protein [Gammaproteobacteria bacterium]|nr:MotA/TolQ/ExbB proton channel family protein [Gammaproteobacteria bacterium]